jgi:hypothetical protein
MITDAFPAQSQYCLQLSPENKLHNMFHIKKLKLHHPNNPVDFPLREPPWPDPILVNGEEEYTVESIVDETGTGARRKYLMHWAGYPSSDDSWLPCSEVEDLKALETWEATKAPPVQRRKSPREGQ